MLVLHVNKKYPIVVTKDNRNVNKVFFNKQHVWKFPPRNVESYPLESKLPPGSHWNNITRTYQVSSYHDRRGNHLYKEVDVSNVGSFRYAYGGNFGLVNTIHRNLPGYTCLVWDDLTRRGTNSNYERLGSLTRFRLIANQQVMNSDDYNQLSYNEKNIEVEINGR